MSKLRKSARDENCTLRVPGVCNFDPATTVLAHLNSHGKGLSLKSHDLLGVFACYSCHSWLDGHHGTLEERAVYSLSAHNETLMRWHELGLIKIAGEHHDSV